MLSSWQCDQLLKDVLGIIQIIIIIADTWSTVKIWFLFPLIYPPCFMNFDDISRESARTARATEDAYPNFIEEKHALHLPKLTWFMPGWRSSFIASNVILKKYVVFFVFDKNKIKRLPGGSNCFSYSSCSRNYSRCLMSITSFHTHKSIREQMSF